MFFSAGEGSLPLLRVLWDWEHIYTLPSSTSAFPEVFSKPKVHDAMS